MTLPDGTARTYTFDLDSNRASIVENGATVSTYTYDPSVTSGTDELTSVTTSGNSLNYRYDADGDLIARGSDTLTWDGRGRSSGGTFGGTTVAYGFDATGFRRLRVAGGTTIHYLLDGLFETDASGSVTLTGIDSPSGDIAHYAGAPTMSSTVTYCYYNDHGDLAAEASTAGTRTAAYTYDPFGTIRAGSSPSNSTAERWVGAKNKKFDSASGFIEMGARPYDPVTGRFASVDPVEGGSLNNYDYATQDPVNMLDLDGTAAYIGYCTGEHDEWNGKILIRLQDVGDGHYKVTFTIKLSVSAASSITEGGGFLPTVVARLTLSVNGSPVATYGPKVQFPWYNFHTSISKYRRFGKRQDQYVKRGDLIHVKGTIVGPGGTVDVDFYCTVP